MLCPQCGPCPVCLAIRCYVNASSERHFAVLTGLQLMTRGPSVCPLQQGNIGVSTQTGAWIRDSQLGIAVLGPTATVCSNAALCQKSHWVRGD